MGPGNSYTFRSAFKGKHMVVQWHISICMVWGLGFPNLGVPFVLARGGGGAGGGRGWGGVGPYIKDPNDNILGYISRKVGKYPI